MRVLHILNAVEHSGAEVMIRQTAPDLRLLGWETVVLATGEWSGGYESQMEAAGVPIRRLPFSKSPAFAFGLCRVIREGDFQAVHVHTERASFWVEAIARLAGVSRVVRTLHACFPFEGALRFRRSVQRRIASRMLGVRHVFISADVAQNEWTRFGTRGTLVSNFVDEREYTPPLNGAERMAAREALAIDCDEFVVVSVGQCSPVKRHGDIIRAVPMLAEDGVEVRYLHIGDGPDMRAETMLAEQLGVLERISFLGVLDVPRSALIAGDAFAMPSEYEGVGIAALEAAACGLPLVVYDSPGLREVVDDGRCGLLARDVPSLADALERLAQDGALRRSLAAAGRASVLRRYKREDYVKEHAALYAGVEEGQAECGQVR
jgi:glycosyltransferase involved in cell wall biosynthesis